VSFEPNYEQKKLPILDGGLNLLTPGDRIPSSGAIQSENWRVDSAGALRSRSSCLVADTLPLATGKIIHTIGQRGAGASPNYYFGYGTNLYTGVNPSSALASGFSGNPMGIAQVEGSTWVMDTAKQIREDGSGVYNWGVAAPAAACTPSLTGTGTLPPPDPNGSPAGQYEYFVTFVASGAGAESNPGPASAKITAPAGSTNYIYLTAIPTSPDPQVTSRNIYRAGGTQGATLQVGTINDNTTTTFIDDMADVTAALEGLVMATNHDPPPPASSVVGPYFGYLIAFNSVAHPNRLWWSLPAEPSYWPGALLADGQWVDVGDDGEAILAVTVHSNVLVIYKQYSIWRIVGTPDLGTLEQCSAQYGILGARAAVSAGPYDYFATGEGVYKFDLDRATEVGQPIKPIFLGQYTPLGAGNQIQPLDPAYSSLTALGYANGRLFVSYPEPTAPLPAFDHFNSCILVYHEDSQKWATMRINSPTGVSSSAVDCFHAVGTVVFGSSNNVILQLYQNQTYTGQNDLGNAVNLYWQSRYEDAGLPGNPKTFISATLDCELYGDTLSVYAMYNNGPGSGPESTYLVATITSSSTTGRQQYPIALNGLGLNMSLRVECAATQAVVLHGLVLYAAPMPPFLETFWSLPFDLGVGKVKETKELQLDISNTSGPATATVYSDLPGNAIASRATATVPQGTTRRPLSFPFAMVTGRLFALGLSAAANQPFQLYAARLLVRVIGVYVEAYEAAAGFVWDSQVEDFGSSITHVPRQFAYALYANPIKTAKTIELQIWNTGPVTVTLLSDLPNDEMASVFTATIAASTSHRTIHLPLPQGTTPEVEGRLWQLQISGSSQFILYAAALEILPIGVAIETYEAAGGATYDSREVDFGTQKPKECREIELDIQTSGAITAAIYSDLPSLALALQQSWSVNAPTRRKVNLVLPANGPSTLYTLGRLWKLLLSGSYGFRLYGIRAKVREIGTYVMADEASGGAIWDSTPIDDGAPQVKVYDQVRFLLDTMNAAATVTVYTDLPGEQLTQRAQFTFNSGLAGPRWMTGEMPAMIYGRTRRVTVSCASPFILYEGQVAQRRIGRYLAANVPDALRVLESDLGSPRVKEFKKLEIDIQTDGPLGITFYTDQSGSPASAWTTSLAAANERQVLKLRLPPAIRGRICRIEFDAGAGDAFIYGARVWTRPLNEPNAQWAWAQLPVEPSQTIPEWVALPVEPTPPQWTWAPLPVSPTAPQWNWAKFLGVEDTPDVWTWVDVPVGQASS
jgi:hypothetical protein